jgi:subtilase family serine protease
VTIASTPAAAAATTPPCSADWGDLPAVGFPAGYSPTAPLDLCGYQPSQLRGAYGVTASGLTGSGVRIAVVDAYDSPTMRADADMYATRHGDRPFAQGQYQEYVDRSRWTHTTDGVCQTPSDWSGEQALDVEMAHGLAPDATVRYFGADSCTDADLTAAMAQIVDSRLADFVTGSFGETMHQTSGDIDPAIVTQENQIFMKGATEGIGFNVSSGDCGDDAAGLTGPNCDPQSARAQTEWPASSPWVTAVGGTALAASRTGAYQWETNMGDSRSVLTADGRAWDPFPGFFYFGGGGGTSEDFAQPSYQAGVVPDAVARRLPSGVRSPKPMRTVPDVAMNGDLLTAVFVGQTDPETGQYTETQVGGTSASAPMFAAVLADAAQGAHKTFGFVNPMLYQGARSGLFTDVVDHPAAAPNPVSTVLDLGSNADGSRKVRLYELGQDHGLSAVAGYDEATGLGSPRKAFLTSFGR